MVETIGVSTTPGIPAGWTRGELRAIIGKYFGYHRGKVTGGSASYVVDSSLVRYADDYWNGACLYVLDADGAPPQGDEATVIDFTSSTGRLDLAPALSATVEGGDSYELFQRVTASQIHEAINRVASGSLAVSSLTAAGSGTVDYSLIGIDGLYRPQQVESVWWRQAVTGLRRQPVELEGWRIEDNAGVLTLRLREPIAQDDSLWLHYRLGPGGLQHDDSKVNLPPTLVRARAIVYLLENMLSTQDALGIEKYGTLLRDMREVAAREAAAYQPLPQRAHNVVWTSTSGTARYYRIFGV